MGIQNLSQRKLRSIIKYIILWFIVFVAILLLYKKGFYIEASLISTIVTLIFIVYDKISSSINGSDSDFDSDSGGYCKSNNWDYEDFTNQSPSTLNPQEQNTTQPNLANMEHRYGHNNMPSNVAGMEYKYINKIAQENKAENAAENKGESTIKPTSEYFNKITAIFNNKAEIKSEIKAETTAENKSNQEYVINVLGENSDSDEVLQKVMTSMTTAPRKVIIDNGTSKVLYLAVDDSDAAFTGGLSPITKPPTFNIKAFNTPNIARGTLRDGTNIINNEMKYSDYNLVPNDNGFLDNYERGASYLPPNNWYPTFINPPVCVSEKKCPVCPMNTSGTELDLKEWDSSRRITQPDNINTAMLINKYNSGK